MSVFKEDCPHCGTKSVAFSIVQEIRFDSTSWDTLMTCGNCGRGVLATFQGSGEKPTQWVKRGDFRNYIELKLSPPKLDTGAPMHTPENVAKFYAQGVDNLPGNWDAAGSMFRKTLETALKNKFPKIDGDLYHRIEGAAKDGGLTQDLAEWAHQIRLDGRSAVHEEEPFS
ncbi:MAG: DUF4145 domain-containing protein, partial [Rhodospirillaceae bacterium]|nr:DUF4145 domain-containing protein [Rhodospirillaceae bacterium]